MIVTRVGDNGFREVLCPGCGRWVEIMSQPDDTRWRYAVHQNHNTYPMLLCHTSEELVPVPRAAEVRGEVEG